MVNSKKDYCGLCSPCRLCRDHEYAEALRSIHKEQDTYKDLSVEEKNKVINLMVEKLSKVAEVSGLPSCYCFFRVRDHSANLQKKPENLSKLVTVPRNRMALNEEGAGVSGAQEVTASMSRTYLKRQAITIMRNIQTRSTVPDNIKYIGVGDTISGIFTKQVVRIDHLLVDDPTTHNAVVLTLNNSFRLGYCNTHRFGNNYENWCAYIMAILDIFKFGGVDDNEKAFTAVHGMVIVGDFNVPNFFNEKNDDPFCKKLNYILKKFGLTPVSKRTTHNQGNAIDYTCFSNNLTVVNENMLDNRGYHTDHLVQEFWTVDMPAPTLEEMDGGKSLGATFTQKFDKAVIELSVPIL